MNEVRLGLADFLERITVTTFTKVDGRHQNILYEDKDIHRDVTPDIASLSASGITSLFNWTTQALKYNGLCYRAEVPQVFVLAGVSALSFKLHIKQEYEHQAYMTHERLRGWEIFLHYMSHFHRSQTLRYCLPIL